MQQSVHCLASSVSTLASLADWSDRATLLGTVAALVGIALVFVQLRKAADSSRAQATIQFQDAFRRANSARSKLQGEFPIHTSLLPLIPHSEQPKWAVWDELRDLSQDQQDLANEVIGSLNDVAQYVADGLEIRSAMQQYHVVFIRVGALLGPYVDQKNRPRHDGTRPPRWGRRVPVLFNTALDYQHLNPLHSGRVIELTRPAANGSGTAAMSLCGGHREISRHPGFPDEPPERASLGPRSLRSALRAHQRKLRPNGRR